VAACRRKPPRSAPCLTPSDTGLITIAEGTNTLAGSSTPALLAGARRAISEPGKRGRVPELWDGNAAQRVGRQVVAFLDARRARAGAGV
jgi:UDP-N-acetylglucosamine 2-epimerase (non-hydrolysing)